MRIPRTLALCLLVTAVFGCEGKRKSTPPNVSSEERPPAQNDNDKNQRIPILLGEGSDTKEQASFDSPFEDFNTMRARLIAEKPAVEAEHLKLLNERYDLSNKPATGVTMFRGKKIQEGVRAKLPIGVTWDTLNTMTPEQIKEKGAFPLGFMPLPHVKHVEGGQVFPVIHINEIAKQEGRDLKRFDVDFDLPDLFTPEFPPAIFLTSRTDLGDVSKGQLVTSKNFYELFVDILTPRELDGLRLLVTPFAQQQFNLTADRRSDGPQIGVACFDCHANGSTNGAFHLDPNTRPQEMRRRLDTPTLRGVNIQFLLGSQRALKTVEDFTEFEQLGAYFDGDHVAAARKGFNKLDRALQVAHMAEMQNLLDFPPAPKLDLNGNLIESLATDAEKRGEALFFGKAQCATCHMPPYYTDNTMHDLKTERFFKTQTINGRVARGDGPIKTFPLRGIKETPPYLNDGRLLTLDDTVEFFNLIFQLKLTTQEKQDIVSYLRVL